jgi:probable rRNA maturation factor
VRVRLELETTYRARRPWAPRRVQFEAWARRALENAERKGQRGLIAQAVLSIGVVGAARSRTLNARYRRKDRPTNVLSFQGAGAMPDGRYFLGELVICAPVVAREAAEQGKSVESHWAHLTVHGVLHLLGFDHERPGEAKIMEAKEVQILDRLGISNPYV